MAAASNEYDPTGVIAAANEKLLAGDLEGGQFVFQSALLQWTDDARESSSISESLREAVATLWLAYAQFLVQAKQFKSATEAYEEATNCSVAGSSGRVYAEYARFAMERQKRKTAQDVYIKALVANGSGAVTDEQDRELLWNDFLEMMRATNPNLTMAALRQAVTEQETTISANNLPPSAKRLKLGDSDDYNNSESAVISSVSTKITTTASAITESKTHVVTAETVEMEAQQQLAEALQPHNAATHNLPPGVMAAWMSRDGHAEPQAPEPPLFAPSPPKLSDPTAKDLLGIDLAVHLVERLLSPSGGVVLEVCRALWTLQALKEQESWESIVALDKSLVAEHERLESELDARLSIAGAVSNAVSQMNQRERHNFQINAGQQRQHVLNQSAWSFRQLLCWQQQALATLDVPGFEEGPTVDAAALQLQSQICQYLHSAFYIRNRMGSEPHETMLRSQLKKLQKEQEGCRSPKQASTTNSVPMVRQHSPLPPPSYNSHNIMTGGNLMMPIMQPQQQHLQQQQQTSYNPYPPQQQPPLQQQPMMMGMHTYAPQGMLYGQQQQPPMMMMQQQQLYLPPQLPLPPLPPSQPQPPPYGGQPQYPYYQQ